MSTGGWELPELVTLYMFSYAKILLGLPQDPRLQLPAPRRVHAGSGEVRLRFSLFDLMLGVQCLSVKCPNKLYPRLIDR